MRYFIPILFILSSCGTSTEKQRISDPEVGPSFYQSAFEEVDTQYQETPTDVLLKQKLYYLEMMDWPPMSLSSLQEATNAWGLSEDLVGKYVRFYLVNSQYGELRDLLNAWGKLHELTESMQEANIIAHKELSLRSTTRDLLSDYIYDFPESSNLEFVARQYLEMGDTLMSIYHYSRLFSKEPARKSLVNEYVPLLLKVHKPERAKQILISASKSDTTAQTQLMLAKSLYQLGEQSNAMRILRNQGSYASNELMMQWFLEQDKWDSATVYVDKLIAIDSSRQWIFIKASIYEERGLLKASYDQLRYLVDSDPSDLIAKERADEVAQKIAYLRDLRESRRDTTLLNLAPKRLLDNE